MRCQRSRDPSIAEWTTSTHPGLAADCSAAVGLVGDAVVTGVAAEATVAAVMVAVAARAVVEQET
eukprot:2432881-Prymnesium_polylepis.1